MATLAATVQSPLRPDASRAPTAPESAPIEPLAAVSAARWFWSFVTVHVLAWSALPAIVLPNRPLDMVEMLYWGHEWQWGYFKHPPLPAWIAEAVCVATGGWDWPLYLVGPMSVGVSMWAAWTLAKEYVGPWAAVCAAALVQCNFYYNLMTADINNTIIEQPLWALAVLALYRSLTTGRMRYWLATGVALGLGMLAKYDVAILACAMLLLPAVSRPARAALRTPRPYLALAVSLAIFAPHVAWMIDTHFTTVLYAVERADHVRSWQGHIKNPLSFVLSQAVTLAPMLAIAWPLLRSKVARRAAPISCERLKRDFLWVVCLGPFFIEVLISVVSGVKIQSMWGAPLWAFAGLALVLWCGRNVPPRVFRAVVIYSGVFGATVLVAMVGRATVLPHVRGKASRIHYPGPQLAAAVADTWRQYSDRPLPMVGGAWWPAANVGCYTPDRVPVFDCLEPDRTPWLPPDALASQGGVLLWHDDADGNRYAQHLKRQFPDAVFLEPIELPWQTSAKLPPLRVCMAVVLPAERTGQH